MSRFPFTGCMTDMLVVVVVVVVYDFVHVFD